MILIIIKVVFHISDCYLMLLLMVISHLQQRHENVAQSGLWRDLMTRFSLFFKFR